MPPADHSQMHASDTFPPQMGTTLPPQTQGSIKGYISFIAHCIMWKDPQLFNNHGELNIRWWGEQKPGVYLSPPTCNNGNLHEIEKKIPHVEERHYVEMKYPVRCTKNAVRKYFKDFGALPVLVSIVPKDGSDPQKIGETFVTLSKIPMDNDGVTGSTLKRWLSVHDEHSSDTLASILIEMKLEHQDKTPLEDDAPEPHTTQKRIKKRTKKPATSTTGKRPNKQQEDDGTTPAERENHNKKNTQESRKKRPTTATTSKTLNPRKKSQNGAASKNAKKPSHTERKTQQNAKQSATEKSTSQNKEELLMSPIVTKIHPQPRNPPSHQQNILPPTVLETPADHPTSKTVQDKNSSPSPAEKSPFRMSSYQQESYQPRNEISTHSPKKEDSNYPEAHSDLPSSKQPPQSKVSSLPPDIHDEDQYLDYVLNNAQNLAQGMDDFISRNQGQMYDTETGVQAASLPPSAPNTYGGDDYLYAPTPTDDYIHSNPYQHDFDEDDDDDFSASVSSTSSLGADLSGEDEEEDDDPISIIPRYPLRSMQQRGEYTLPREGSTLAMPQYQSTLQQRQQNIPEAEKMPSTENRVRSPPTKGIRVDASLNGLTERQSSHQQHNDSTNTTFSDDSHVENSFEEDDQSSEEEPAVATRSPTPSSDKMSLKDSIDEADEPNLASPKIPRKGSPNQEFCFLVHVASGKLLGTQRSEHFNLSCRLPFVKNTEKKSIFTFHSRTEHSPLGIFHVYTIDPSEKDFFTQMEKRSFVIELSEAGGKYLGVATLPLKKFYNCFTERLQWKPKNAVCGHNGEVVAINPLTGVEVAEFNVFTAFGTKKQIREMQEMVLPSKRIVYDLQGKPVKKKLSSVKEVQKMDSSPQIEDREAARYQTERNMHPVKRNQDLLGVPSTKPTRDMSPLSELKPKQSAPAKSLSPIRTSPPKVEKLTAVPIRSSSINVEIIRASGLQQAARVAKKHNPQLEYACQNGVNPFVSFRIFDDHLYDDEYLVRSDFETPIVGRTFCPTWHFSKSLRFQFNEESYHFLESGEAQFLVFHHFPKSIADTVQASNVLLGIAKVDLTPLLLYNTGIRTWFTLYSADESEEVGAIEVQITLDEATKRILKVNKDHDAVSLDLDSSDSEGDDLSSIAALSPRASYFADVRAKKSMCKLTCSVEEIFIPQDVLLKHTPEYTKQYHPLFECQYFITYDHVNSSHVESRLYRASNSVNHLTLQHSSEVTMSCDDHFEKMLKEKQIRIHLHVCIDSQNDDEKSVRQNAILLGTAHVHLSKLHEKRMQEKGKISWISGLYPLINPHADNMKNGKMRIRFICETLSDKPTVTDQLRALKLEKDLHRSGRVIDAEDEIRESLRSGYSVRSSMRRKAVVSHTPAPIVRDEPAQTSRVPEEQDRGYGVGRTDEDLQISNRQPPRKLDDSLRQKLIDTDVQRTSISTAQQTNGLSGEEKTPINHLKILIHSAMHLPSVQSKSSLRTSPPSTYVSIITPNYDGDPKSMWKSLVKTPVVAHSNSPSWEFSYRLPIYEDIDKIFLQVFHKYKGGSKEKEILIGDVTVELDLLRYGCDEVEGWFLVQNPASSHQSNASICVTVRPEKPFTSLAHSHNALSPKSVQLLDEEKEEEDSFVLKSLDQPGVNSFSEKYGIREFDLDGINGTQANLPQDSRRATISLESGSSHQDGGDNSRRFSAPPQGTNNISTDNFYTSESSRVSNADEYDNETSTLKSKLESCLKDLDSFSVRYKS